MSAEAHPGCASNEPTSIAIGHREQIHFRKKLGLQGGGGKTRISANSIPLYRSVVQSLGSETAVRGKPG